MNLVYASESEIKYPYSLLDLRRDNPNVSFSFSPTAADLAPFFVYEVKDTPLPTEFDERTERVEETDPIQLETGEWVQSWRIRPATTEEIQAWDSAHAPVPDWMGFGVELAVSASISGLYEVLPAPVANGLSIGLNEASRGDPRLFIRLLHRVLPSGIISPQLLQEIAETGQRFNLPESFITSLTSPA